MAETREGGLYRVGDGLVDAKGEKVKGEAAEAQDSSEAPKESASMPYADALAGAGFDTPEKVRTASDDDLLAIEGIGPARLAEIRAFKG